MSGEELNEANRQKAAHQQAARVSEYFSGPDAEHRFDDLVAYAADLTRRSFVFGKKGGSTLPEGNMAEDIVETVVAKALSTDISKGSGRRNIPPHVPLEAGLRMVIRSRISALVNGEENQLLRREAELRFNDDEQNDKPLDRLAVYEAERDLEVQEERDQVRERINRFREFVADDGILSSMLLLAINEDLTDPADEIARRLGITRAQVFAARKRHRTKLAQFKKREEQRK